MRPDKRGAAGRWAPCPWAIGAERGALQPGEPGGCAGTSHAVALKGDEWYCHRCQAGGGPVTLARLLGETLPEGYEPTPPPPPEDKPGSIDVGAAWAALKASPAGWEDTVRRALVARGWPELLAERVQGHPDVLGRPGTLQAVPGPARALYRAIDVGRGLWVALRDEAGVVRDVAARWTDPGGPPEGLKMRRLWTPLRGQFAGPVVFGSIPDVLGASRAGKPIVLVEGEIDYLAACAVARGRAHVLGIPGTGSERKVVAMLTATLAALPPEVPRPTVWAVPDVGDLLDQPEHKAHLIGERGMLAAVLDELPTGSRGAAHRALIDVAAVRWSLPIMCRATARRLHPVPAEHGPFTIVPSRTTGPRGDLEDLARSADPDAVWQALRSGLTLVHDGDNEWRECSDAEVRAACYRLTLGTALDAINWRPDDNGGPPEWKPAHYTRVEHVCMAWFKAHGARWFHDNERALVIWRGALYDVSSAQWAGELDRIGRINPVKDGKFLVAKMVATCFHNRRGAVVASPFWAGEGEVRIHLHQEEADSVMRVRAGRVDLVDNGTRTRTGRQVVQEASMTAVDPVTWCPDITPVDAARLLFDVVGRWWTVAPAERVMMASYLVVSLVRHELRDRPILWLAGESASGKTIATELIVSVLYGERGRVLSDPTPVSLTVQGKTLPIIAVDNAENSGASGKRHRLERLLLNAATGKQMRTKGTKEGGVVGQELHAMMAVTAIEPPTLHELTNRCLMTHHCADHRDPAFRPGVIGNVAQHRSAIISGMGAMWGVLLPRLDEVGRVASTVPSEHPLARMRETLALMAIVGEALGSWDRRWTELSAVDLLAAWMVTQGERASSVQALGNPILAALDALLRRFNRVEARGDGMWQPAVESDELATTPVFAMHPDAVAEQRDRAQVAINAGHEPPPIYTLTLNVHEADHVERYGYAAAKVVGMQGTHAELYQDLVSTMQRVGLRAEFVEAVASASVLGARAAHIRERWHKVQLSTTSPRRYQYCPVTQEHR